MSKSSKILLTITIILIVVIVILSILLIKKGNKYDTSFMREVTVNEILDIMESENHHVIYVGRKTCALCEKFLPILKDASITQNFTPLYLDIENVDRTSSNWEELIKKLKLESTQTLNESDEGETVTETYGYFLDNYGFTPTVIITKSGKQEAGFIGYKSKTDLIKFLKEKGID